jgi:hypothetical protein
MLFLSFSFHGPKRLMLQQPEQVHELSRVINNVHCDELVHTSLSLLEAQGQHTLESYSEVIVIPIIINKKIILSKDLD